VANHPLGSALDNVTYPFTGVRPHHTPIRIDAPMVVGKQALFTHVPEPGKQALFTQLPEHRSDPAQVPEHCRESVQAAPGGSLGTQMALTGSQ
jgi:hypothetical protein